MAQDAHGGARAQEAERGDWLHNPVTGELTRTLVAADGTGGRRLEAELWLQPGAAVVGAHVHDHLDERFELLDGEVAFLLEGQQRRARRGEAVDVPAGAVHDWWNAGDGVAHVRVTVAAAQGAPGEPAARFEAVIEVLWSLAAQGRTNAKGLPDPLWLAAIAREFRDAIRFTKPPKAVQAVVFPPLAALAGATGRDPLAPHLHGDAAPARIAPPDDATLRALLAREVDAATARDRR